MSISQQSIHRRNFLAGAGGLAFPSLIRARSGSAGDRPNILWILAEDLGPQLACYGRPLVKTPNLDRLASQGVRFLQAHTTGPVCSASRSGFNTGLYQTSIGAQNHRSHRTDGYALPQGVRLISERMREQGYFTANVLQIAEGVRGTGKTDYNFANQKPFDGTHWNQRRPGQPFYAQINMQETHKGPAMTEARRQKDRIDQSRIELAPYYPDDPVVRDEVGTFLDCVNLLDRKVGVILDALEKDKLTDNTIVFFMGDNGRCLLRGKQWCYDTGTHVPMMVRWPGVAKPGALRKDPVLSLDMTATSLAAAGIPLPEYFHGRPLFGAKAKPREFVVTARDRCDETVDRIRAVFDGRYRYIRNFMPERPYTQPNEYIRKSYPTLGVLQRLHAEGKLNAVQELFMAPRKPPVEFYDNRTDPHEVNNLASSPKHKASIDRFSKTLDAWLLETKDLGGVAEPESARRLK